MNPLFESLQFGNMNHLLNQFEQFKSQFQGDPKAQVQRMLNSGQISQEQFNQVSQMATRLQNLIQK